MSDTSDPVAERWSAAGLFDPAGPEAAEILEVLHFYASVGIEPDTYNDVDVADPLRDINERMLVSGERFSAATVSERLGISSEEFDVLRQNSGYDTGDVYTELDIESFSGFQFARLFFSDDELMYFTRALTSSMENLADASVSLFRIDVATDMDRSGATAVDFARKNLEAAEVLERLFVPMRAIFLRQLLNAVRRNDATRITDHESGSSNLKMAVGFVDIVGFTARTEHMSPADLDLFIRSFEEQAFTTVNQRGGRVVKLIGDEVMFIDVDPVNAVRIADALIDAFADLDALPRAGVAYGELISRGGDYYGRVVNLAARLTSQADAGQILSDSVSTEAMPEGVTLTSLGAATLKGFSDEIEIVAARPIG